MLGKNWFENFLPDRIRDEILPISKKLLSGEIDAAEYVENLIKTKSGEERLILWHNIVIRDENGNITGYLSSGEDVTDKRIADARLKESEEKFRTIADKTYSWEYWTGIDGNFIYCSPSCKRITGYAPEEFYSDKNLFSKIIHPEDKDLFRNHIINENHSAHLDQLDFRIITREGTVEWLGHVCGKVQDSKGKDIGIRGSNRLISRYKYDELRTKMLSEIVKQSPSAIVITDRDGNIEYVNESFTKVTGYSYEEVMGKNPRILNSGKTDPQIFVDLWDTITKGKTWSGDFNNMRKNGEEYYENAVISPTLNESGEIVNYFAVKENVTSQRLAEQALLKSEKELKEANAMKDKLFSIIAHDLRNPFNAILGFSDLLLKNSDQYDKEKQKEIIAYISEGAEKASVLLENLLEWSRTKSGKIAFNPDNHILEKIILEGINEIEIIAKQKNISLSYKLDENSIIHADLAMINTVLRNLISNSIKFTPKFGKIEIMAQKNDDSVTISVKDSGVGIRKEKLQEIFSIVNYETTKGTENEQGSGLGLVLCREFVEKHGGKIWAESELGEGSIFSFSLPLSAD